MRIDDETCYRALVARDARFDGLFFVGVTSTGIYCRPICTARTVGRARCRFFSNSALAERAGISALPALPAGAGSGACAGGCSLADRPGGRSADRSGGLEQRRKPGTIGLRTGSRHAAASPGGPARVRRFADRAGPDPAACFWPSNCSPNRICRSRKSRLPAALKACADSMRCFARTTASPRRGCAARRLTSQAHDVPQAHAGLPPAPGVGDVDAVSRRTVDGGSRNRRGRHLLADGRRRAVIGDG